MHTTFDPKSHRSTACVALAALLGLGLAAHARAQHWALPLESPQAGGLTAFAARSDGYLIACKTDGNDPNAGWTTSSHGKPGQGAVGEASAHFHSTNTDLYVFTRTTGGDLYLRSAPQAFNNGNPAWSWANLGKPAATTIVSDPASISYNGREYAFVRGADDHLYVAYGAPWAWADLGSPSAGLVLMGRPSAVVFDGKLYAFVVGSNGQLYTRYWNGSAWNWVNLGMPGAGAQVTGSTAAVAHGSYIHVFVPAVDQHLYVRYWNGSSWQWRDQGNVANGIAMPDAAWFDGQNGKSDLYAYAMRFTGTPSPELLENHWDSNSGWHLTRLGAPTSMLKSSQPAIAGSFNGPIQTWPTWRISVFAHADNDRIYRGWYGPINNVWQWLWTSGHCQM